jgi:hypothetical protein
VIWPTYASIVRLDAIYLTTFGRISGVIDTPADDLRTGSGANGQGLRGGLIGDADAPREINEPWSAQPILAPCDVEPLRLLEPCTQCLLSRPPDHLLIGTRIADHLPQRREFSGFRKTRLTSLRLSRLGDSVGLVSPDRRGVADDVAAIGSPHPLDRR